jgi:hypothetical protein
MPTIVIWSSTKTKYVYENNNKRERMKMMIDLVLQIELGIEWSERFERKINLFNSRHCFTIKSNVKKQFSFSLTFI